MSVGLPGLMNDLLMDAFENVGKVVVAAGRLFADDGGPKQSPADLTRETLFGTAGSPPQSPAPSPTTPDGGSGGLETGAQGAGDEYNTNSDGAALTDAKLAEMVKQIFASNQAARDKVFAILAEIQNKQKQIGPELGDPASVTLFQQFIDQKFGEIQKILNDTQVDAKTQAAILDALADEYRNSGPQRDEDGGQGASGGDDAAAAGGDPAAAGGDPAAAGGDPAAVGGTDPLMDPLAGMGPLGGGVGMDPLSAMGPALAGLGSLPGAMGGLGGSPLDALGPALGSLGQLGSLANGFGDKPAEDTKLDDGFSDKPADGVEPPGGEPTDGFNDAHEQKGEPGTEPVGSSAPDNRSDPAAAPAEPAPETAVPASASTPAAPADAGRQVTMPDGSIVTAGDDKTAAAMRAVLSGSGVTDAFNGVDVQLPPPGTPVTAPVDPARLQPGCLGNFESREPVMAMGNGKIWMDGQLQPIGVLGSSSDFLGWSKPPTAAATALAAPAAPVVPAAPVTASAPPAAT